MLLVETDIMTLAMCVIAVIYFNHSHACSLPFEVRHLAALLRNCCLVNTLKLVCFFSNCIPCE